MKKFRDHSRACQHARGLVATLAMTLIACAPALAQPPTTPADPSDHMLMMHLKSMKWDPIVPALGKGSPTITILRVDPRTHATQLMIHVPKSFHVTSHWHSANETHTIVKGTFIMESEGMAPPMLTRGPVSPPAPFLGAIPSAVSLCLQRGTPSRKQGLYNGPPGAYS